LKNTAHNQDPTKQKPNENITRRKNPHKNNNKQQLLFPSKPFEPGPVFPSPWTVEGSCDSLNENFQCNLVPHSVFIPAQWLWDESWVPYARCDSSDSIQDDPDADLATIITADVAEFLQNH
jgi:hypothetical protein